MSNSMCKPLVWLGLGCAVAIAQAQEFRQLNRIASPGAAPAGTRAVQQTREVPKAKVEAAVAQIAAAWNTPNLESTLADNFYGKSRLDDALATKVPRDAKLQIMAIQGMQTLGQYAKANASGGEDLISRVSVTVRTQIEYNDPRTGFQRLDGTNEFIVLITEPAS